ALLEQEAVDGVSVRLAFGVQLGELAERALAVLLAAFHELLARERLRCGRHPRLLQIVFERRVAARGLVLQRRLLIHDDDVGRNAVRETEQQYSSKDAHRPTSPRELLALVLSPSRAPPEEGSTVCSRFWV